MEESTQEQELVAKLSTSLEKLDKSQETWNERITGLETGFDNFKKELIDDQHPEKRLSVLGKWTGNTLTNKETDFYQLVGGLLMARYKQNYQALDQICEKYAIPVTKDVTNVDTMAVPREMYPLIWQKILQSSVFLQDAMRIPMRGNYLTKPYMDESLTTYWVGKGSSITASDAVLQQLTYIPRKLAVFTILNQEDIDDSLPDLIPSLNADAASQMARTIDTWGFTGVDTGSNEGEGVMTMAASAKNVDIADAAALAPTYAEIWEGIGNLDTVQLAGAKFYMHPAVWATIRGIVDTAGMPIWQPSLNNEFTPYTLCGFPVRLVDALPSAISGSPSTATKFMLFGNLEHWPYADRMSLSFDFSDHLKFQNYQRCLRWILRIAFPQFESSTNGTLENYFVTWTNTTAP